MVSHDIPPALAERLEKSTDTLERHKSHPDVSLDMYARGQRHNVGLRALSRHRIYLDQRYWIHCRDAFLGRPTNPQHTRIWRGLCNAVKAGRLWCPAFGSVLAETMKQKDLDSRRATACVVDQLSGGLALQPPIDRGIREISHYTWTKLLGDTTLGPAEHYVWVRVGHIMGELFPMETAFPPDLELAMQKTMYDLQATQSLEDFVRLVDSAPYPADDDRLFQAVQNLMCDVHRQESSDYEDARSIELRGVAGLWMSELHGFAEDLFRKGKRVELDGAPTTPRELALNLMAIVVAGLRMGRIQTELPCLHVQTGIHAAMRFKRQKFQKGDTHDFQHAAAALPYCNALFTERRLGNLLTREPLWYDELYDCRVLWREQDVIEHIENL
ncbi:MAG: hypothetical protein GY842_26080 [bacterium]|nr:hypothetical protein [bacterium]